MINLVFTSVLAGLTAFLVHQRINYPFFWVDYIYFLKLRRYKKTLQASMQLVFATRWGRTPIKHHFQNRTRTYQEVDSRSDQFAFVFRTVALVKQGDVVALWMFNEPDFICEWLWLCKLNCEVAFLNVNIKATSLSQCIHSSEAKVLIVSAGNSCFLSRYIIIFNFNCVSRLCFKSSLKFQIYIYIYTYDMLIFLDIFNSKEVQRLCVGDYMFKQITFNLTSATICYITFSFKNSGELSMLIFEG